jgi:hypothetical protein
VHIIAPVDESESSAPTIDLIYVEGLAYPGALTPLGNSIREPEGLIPGKFLAEWAGEGDFAGARVFDGEYRDLLRALVGKELRLDLISFLKRESSPSSMRTAAAFAAVDVVRDPSSPSDEEGLITAILMRGVTDYAAPDTAQLSREFAAKFGRLLLRVPQADRHRITGPRYLAPSAVSQLKRNAIAESEVALVNTAHELVIAL